jgi:hypothetical protein
MIVSDVIEGLQRAFPKDVERIKTMVGSYQRVLGDLGPAELKRTWERTIDAWPKSSAPMPADFGANRPSPPPSKAELRACEAVRLTDAARAEQRKLIDRTLQAYADTIRANAEAFAPGWRREIRNKIVVTGADLYRAALAFVLERRTWPLAVETAKSGSGYAHVDLTDADWEEVRERAESRKSGWTGGVFSRPVERVSDRQKAQLRQLADQWRGVTPEPETV